MTVILFQRVKSNIMTVILFQRVKTNIFGIYNMFKMLNHSDMLVYLIHVKFYCYMVLKQIRH